MIPDLPYSNKEILLCPLDWGLGHAARCVPLIRQLLKQNNRVIVACNEWQKKFFAGEFSDLEYVALFGYEVRYSRQISLGLKVLLQVPRLSLLVRKEHSWLLSYLRDNPVDVVISDNRFGLHAPDVESVIMTHQLFVLAPFMKKAVRKLNLGFINKFDSCWVPDHADEAGSLSGALSHGPGVPDHVRYIGALSRFEKNPRKEPVYDVLLLLSGVEPQRSVLEEKLVEALSGSALRVALVRGTQAAQGQQFPKNFSVRQTANTKELEELLLSSKKLICRAGYSTLMDLDALGLKALLIPTPGQTEQEYLAKYWNEKFGFDTLDQKDITSDAIAAWLHPQRSAAPRRLSV